MIPPLFTVIICTYDRSDLLRHCLDSLADQSDAPEDWELLVIDNNSTDATPRVTDDFLAAHPQLNGRRIREAQQGLSHARNRGYREAAADWVIYLDDDARADRRFLARTAELVRDRQYRIVGGVYYPWYHYGRPDWYRDRYASNALPAYRSLSVPPANYVATGGVMLWEKNLLAELGGFDPRVGMVGKRIAYGEETYLQAKARARGIAVAYDPRLIIYHVVIPKKLSVDWFFRSYFAAGRDAVLGGKVKPGFFSLAKELLLAAGVMTKDLLWYTPRLLGPDYYLENWLIDVFRKVAKRVGTVYTALLHDRVTHR
ncbi:GT2 family glycosyltransferase [Neolewinella xylanilytica]|uniref:GT2 family glycosyltransferase n=1 Tax=Neolewinella xylanilytica TaxID=1514080 RepID=A0A2S6I921_9BACT|nr:glycosyltransferase [Neolewinella xylanilytica]PPK87996.1 GT2 family glycosyltransferase [Neolewinella xylanilytica]